MLLEFFITYFLIFTRPVVITNTVDLTPSFPRVFDQGHSNSCTANAIASVVNFHEKQQNNKSHLISRLDLYYQSRTDPKVDRGTTFERSMRVLENNGICDENMWRYDWKQSTSEPSKRCVSHRKVHSGIKPFKIPSNSYCILYAVRMNHPVIIGTMLTKSFDNSDITVPTMKEPIVSKHAMVVVGVTADNEYFVIRNSWGDKWKYKGYITVPHEFVDRFVVNAWVLTPLI